MSRLHHIELLAGKLDMNYSLLTRSGTVAIWLALKTFDVTDKKIIVPANVCFVVVCAIIYSGNRPFVVDINNEGGIDIDCISNLQDSDIAGIIYPYMYGNTGNILEVKKISSKNGWFFIEDVAQALGSKIGKVYAGSIGDVSVVSFGVGKQIDLKNGGAINFNSEKIYKRIKKLYEQLPYFLNKEQRFLELLMNRYNEIISNCKGVKLFSCENLKYFSSGLINKTNFTEGYLTELDNRIRNIDSSVKIRRDYSNLFSSAMQNNAHVKIVKHKKGSTYWRQNILVSKERDELLLHLRKKKIKATTYFPSITKFFAFIRGEKYPCSDSFTKQVINLWPWIETTQDEIYKVNEEIEYFYDVYFSDS